MRRIGTILMLLLFVTAGCSRNAITVDEEVISKQAFDLALKERLASHKALNVRIDENAIKRSVADELVAEALLLKEARSKNIAVTDDELRQAAERARGSKSEKDFKDDLQKAGSSYDLFAKRLKTRLMISKLLTTAIKDDSVTEEEMKAFYARSQVPFLKPEREFVRVLQLSSEEASKNAVAELKRGADFDTLADGLVKSGMASATDYGWLEPDTLPSRELAEAMKTAKIGAAQGPFKAKDGSHYLFRIKERQASQPLPFDEAKERIRNILLNRNRQEFAARVVEDRKKTAKIKINVKLS